MADREFIRSMAVALTMRRIRSGFVLLWGLKAVQAFLPSVTEQVRSHSVVRQLQQPQFLENLLEIPNPFGALKTADAVPRLKFLDDEQDFDPSPEGLFRQAKRVVAADMGIQDPSLLDDRFRWVGPVVDEPLRKTDYLAAGRFFDLRSTFPDLDYRAHDLRLDEADPATVRLTCRATGTMRGPLRLRGTVLPPTGRTMKCPPEAVTMTFDLKSGKLLKLTSGYAMDRLVGNTAGTTGVIAAAAIAGQPVSDWEIYPPVTVLKRFFGRPINQLPEPRIFLAPFPETVMIQLAKGILAANMAAEDASLLAKSFTYYTPTVGSVRKKDFLEKFATSEFEGVDPSFTHFRVDPYNPNVVWVDVRPSAPGYMGAPQAMSFTFDDDGFCTRITSGAIIDPTVGNCGGLAGREGYLYALGTASPAVVTRPLPRVLGRLRRRLIGVFSGKEVDDFETPKPSGRPIEAASSPEKLSILRSMTSADTATTPRAAQLESKKPKQVPQKSLIATPIPSKPDKSTSSPLSMPKLPKMERPQKSLLPTPPASKPDKSASRPRSLPKLPKVELPSALNVKPSQSPKAAKPSAKPSNPFAMGEFKLPDLLPKSPPSTAAPSRRPAAAPAPATRNAATEERQRQAVAAKLASERVATQRKAEEQKRRDAQQAEAKRKAEEGQRKRAEEQARATKQRAEAKLAAEKERLLKEEQRKKEDATQQKQLEAQRSMAEKQQQALQAQKRAQELAKQEAAKKAALATKAAEQKRAAAAAAAQQKLEAQQQVNEKQVLNKLSEMTSRATIGLFAFASAPKDREAEPAPKAKPGPSKLAKKAPFGVPTLSDWRKNLDGSITGIISGSGSFGDGEKVTTSAIAKGTIAAGEVVVTASGSKYFLG